MTTKTLDSTVSVSTSTENVPSAIKSFAEKGFRVRVVMRGDQPWFVAKDVAECIEHSNPSAMCKMCKERDVVVESSVIFDSKLSLESEQTSMVSTNGYTTLISENGLYRILCKSNLPKCEPFESWVFDEVLPSIRKTGSYSIQQPPKTYLEALEELVAKEKARLALEAEKHELELRTKTLEAQNGVMAQMYRSNRNICESLITRGLAKKRNGEPYSADTLKSKTSKLLQKLSHLRGYAVSEQFVVVEGEERRVPFYHIDVVEEIAEYAENHPNLWHTQKAMDEFLASVN